MRGNRRLSSSDLEAINEKLARSEDLKIVACHCIRDGKAKNITILTNERLIFLRKGSFKLFGRGSGLRDIPYHLIKRVEVEERKNYDLLRISLKNEERERFMLPKRCGARVTSTLRHLQTIKKREEEHGKPL